VTGEHGSLGACDAHSQIHLEEIMTNLGRIAVQVGIAMTLVLAGWALGRSQAVTPDFEVVIDAPGGETTIQCVKGCKFAWVGRGINPNAARIANFKYACTGERCSSGRIGGWLNR
jgi:hypothetical protein